MKKVFFIFYSLGFLSSCSYDTEEELYGITICETELMSFTDDVWPIIQENCVSCHGGETPFAGLALEHYSQIRTTALDTTVEGVINRIDRPEGDPDIMPPNSRLEQCSIDKIKAWVEQGALEN